MQNEPILYRAAHQTDAAAIIDFQVAMAAETEEVALDRDVCSRGVRAVFADPRLGRYLVAANEGHVVASLMLTYEWSDWRNGTVWWIQSVYVVPAFRGRGVFAGMYSWVQELAAAEPEVRGLRLYVDRRNESAQQVYARLGMNGEHYQLFEWMK